MTTEHENNSKPGSRHGWWYDHCDTCNGKTAHLSIIDGRCSACEDSRREDRSVEALLARGAESCKMEDRQGDTKSGWWLDGVYLGKTVKDAWQAILG